MSVDLRFRTTLTTDCAALGITDATCSGRLSREELARLGLSKREIDELLAKLAASPADEDFELDLSAARPAEHFARALEAAVPRVDRK